MPYRKEVFGVDVNGDITGLKSAMNEAVKVFNSTERALKNIEKALKLDPTNIDLITAKQELSNKAIVECEKALKKLQKERRAIVNDENFKKGITDESERYTELVRKIAETKDRLKELKETYYSVNQQIDKMNKQVSKSTEAFDEVNRSLKNVEEQLKFDPYNMDLLAQKSDLLTEKMRICEYAVRNYNNSLKEIDPHSVEIRKTQVEFTALAKAANDFAQAGKEAEQELNNMKFQRFADDLSGVSKGMLTISENTRWLSRAFQSMGSTAFTASKTYESSIADIKRVVSDLSDNTISKLKQIAIDTGTAFSDVSAYATFAGALGLAETEVAGFTKTMLDLNTATGGAFGGEEGAKSVVVFLNALGLAVDEAENFGSAIAVVGDKYADIGDETLKIATALSGISTIAKVDQYDLIGLAGVMANLGLSGEAATSGITRAFVQVEKAIAGSADGLEDFASACNMTVKEFTQAWNERPLETFMQFVDSLKGDIFVDINNAIDTSSEKVQKYADLLDMSAETFKGEWAKNAENVFDMIADKMADMDEEGSNAISTLTGVKLTSIRTVQTLLRLAGQGNEVASAVQLANSAWNENTALQNKANGIYDTTERKLEGLFESLKQFGAEIVDVALPTIKKGIDFLTDLLATIKDLDPNMKRLILIFGTFAAGVSPVTKGIGKFLEKLINVGTAVSRAGGLINVLTSALMNPVGLFFALTTVMGALGAFYLLAQDGETELGKLRKNIDESRDSLKELDTEIANNLVAYDLQLHMYDNQVEAIEKLMAKINDERTTEEEAKQVKEELTKKVEELNSALGAGWDYDAVKNLITNENGDVVDLTKAYDNLLTAKRKAYYLEQYEEAYNKALSTQKEALDAIADAKWEYAKATKNYTDEQMAFAQYLAENPADVAALNFLNTLDEADQKAILSARNLIAEQKNTIDSARETVQESQKIIDNYETLAQAEGATLEAYLDRINNGWNIDPAKNDLDAMYEELEKINYLLSNPDGISMETLLQMEEAQQNLYNEIKLTEEAKGKVIEMHGEYASLYEEEMAKEKEKHGQILLDAAMQNAQRVANHESEMARESEIQEFRMSNQQSLIGKQQEQHSLAIDAMTEEQLVEQDKGKLREDNHKRAIDYMADESKRFNELSDEEKKKYIAITQTDEDSIENTSKATFKDIQDMWSGNVNEMADTYKSDVKSAHDELKNYIESNPIVQTIIISTVGGGSPSSATGGGSGGYGYSSGGFNEMIMGAMSNISRTMSNFRSDGYRSGGIVLNANFNVNSNNIGRAEVRSWAGWIVDDLNEALGNQI